MMTPSLSGQSGDGRGDRDEIIAVIVLDDHYRQ
jgi:hypothetical protein